MATLQIRKKSAKVWTHVISDGDTFILSKMYCKTDGDTFRIVEDGGSNRKEYDYSNITVYDDTDASTPETFLNSQALMLRLSALGYVGFSQDGEVVIADLISTDASNAIELGTDGKLFSSGGGGGVTEVANFASLPTTGETGVIYVTTDNNKLYRWSGSAYVEVSVYNLDQVLTTGNTSTQAINVGITTIIGSGSTNSTNSLVVRNSALNAILIADDSLDVRVGKNLSTGGTTGEGLVYTKAVSLPTGVSGGIITQSNSIEFKTRLTGNLGWDSKGIIKYLADYSANYDARSLVDKAYVDSVVVGGGGSTDLSYTASPTDGTVTSSTGTDATILLVDGTNAGLISPTQFSSKQDVLTASNTHTFVDSLTAMTTPVDADKMTIVDNSVSLAKKITWANIKATLKTYFDTLYTAKNTAITGATKTKITYDANGLVTSGADATTSDISEGSNLYFTNARAIASTLTSFVAGTGAISSSDTILTAIQKLAGNSGLKKVINDTTASANQTLTTEVVMKTYEITGGTFVSGSKPNITIGSTKTSGSNAVYTMRLYAGSTNVFASATLIGTYATTSAFIRGFNFERRSFYFDGTTLNGFIPSAAVITDIGQLSTTAWGGMTLNPANSIFLFITLQNGSALDTTRINYVNITE